MQKILYVCLFCLVLLTFLADPAPLTLQLADVVIISLSTLIGIFCLVARSSAQITSTNLNITLAILFYLFYLLSSTLMGVIEGVPFLKILRSVGPYLNFFPLIFLSILSARTFNPKSLALVLCLVGLIQGIYHIYVYYCHTTEITNTFGVLTKRITLIDHRTTLPIILSLPTLSLVLFFNKQVFLKKYLLYSLAIFLIILAFFAGIVTLTRSIVLSILFGWMVFIMVYLIKIGMVNSSHFFSTIHKMGKTLLILSLIVISISMIPKVQLMESGIIARFQNSSEANDSSDYSNGRLFEEWVPALQTWMNSGWLGLFFGIGAGHAFNISTGEDRTYIHNLTIYSLVYGGILGFLSTTFLYFAVLSELFKKAIKTNQIIYLGFFALLSSMYFYGQFFAVHKVLAFNLLLFLIIALALKKPNLTKNTNNKLLN